MGCVAAHQVCRVLSSAAKFINSERQGCSVAWRLERWVDREGPEMLFRVFRLRDASQKIETSFVSSRGSKTVG